MKAMNLAKSMDFFNPSQVRDRIHIIGCGSVGSTVAENLARCGITKMTLYDFDIVESHNIVNQMFTANQIGMSKVEATKELITAINPLAEKDIITKPDGWKGDRLSGFIILAVDNIDLRREIVTKNKFNPNVKAMFDFRTTLEGAQHYAADWSKSQQVKDLLATMEYSHEEAVENTPVSACGYTLGVATTVRLICSYGVNNFINFVKGNPIKTFMLMDGFGFTLDAF